MTTLTHHKGLSALIDATGLTVDGFAKITGIGYSFLRAVKERRRKLSAVDAQLIAATTGCDPSFNESPDSPDIRGFYGQPYTHDTFQNWRNADLPALRATAASARQQGKPDAFEEVLCHNVKAILEAARARSCDLSAAWVLAGQLAETVEKFSLRPALASWKKFSVKFSDQGATIAVEQESMSPVVPAKFDIELGVLETLNRIATEKGVTLADVIREATEKYTEQDTAP